jgi:phosphomannomutase / phosphoglucomutase
MLHAIRDKVLETGADVGLGFDGDGDRCGVVDDEGREIFADKIGVMLARDISALHSNSRFVVDVKSTGLYMSDPVLRRNGATTEYWKTGHSYMKRRVAQLGAIAGFEKSGHFFFNPPIGRGYDDGLVTAIAVCQMLDRNPGRTMADLYRSLPETFGTPTMSPHCDDDRKYAVVERVLGALRALQQGGRPFAGQNIAELVTVNGVRVVAPDGTWGLVRASSNKPEMVVVVESPVSPERRGEMFAAIDALIRQNPEVGRYNQTF